MRASVCAVAVAAMAMAMAMGCATYTPIASHTVATGPDRQADVVWLIDETGDDPVVIRCSDGPQGPVCQPARSTPAKGSE